MIQLKCIAHKSEINIVLYLNKCKKTTQKSVK